MEYISRNKRISKLHDEIQTEKCVRIVEEDYREFIKCFIAILSFFHIDNITYKSTQQAKNGPNDSRDKKHQAKFANRMKS